ncbi:hypothetical protein [Solibaculum intestinale]|uniref:Uncharacterized protein n=1 Tax=Solibaculum intestinale TaxID=3133165 RepID=A0ABV1DW54_9FIRM
MTEDAACFLHSLDLSENELLFLLDTGKAGQIAAITAAGPEDWVHADIFPRAPIMKKERPAMAEEHIEVLEKY